MTPPGAPPAKPRSLSEVLLALGQDATRERVAVGDLLLALDDRAFGALLFVFAFPNVLPTPPGASAVLGAPLVFLSVQLLLGWSPWLPAVVAQRSMSRTDFARLVGRIGPWLARAERLLRPRWRALTRPPVDHAIGLVCLLLALVLVLPIPLGNVVPAFAISVLALGLLARDGLWVLAGLVAALAAAALVSGVIYALVQAAVYLLTKVPA
jgi:hypothetical protein